MPSYIQMELLHRKHSHPDVQMIQLSSSEIFWLRNDDGNSQVDTSLAAYCLLVFLETSELEFPKWNFGLSPKKSAWPQAGLVLLPKDLCLGKYRKF